MKGLLFFLGLLAVVASKKSRYSTKLFVKMSDTTFEELLDVEQPMMLVDPDTSGLTYEQNAILKGKGKTVIAYLSLGQAEMIRDYWKPEWTENPPMFLYQVDPEYKWSYTVRFWDPAWQEILLNYTMRSVATKGYSGVLMDYMGEYKKLLFERPGGAEEMVAFGLKVAALIRSFSPKTLIITQDSAELYKFPEYRDMVDGVSVENVYYKHVRNSDGSYTYPQRPALYTTEMLDILAKVAKDKKAVIQMEYFEKNRAICEFYKKCYLAGYICGVYDLTHSGGSGSRDCVVQTEKA